MPRKTGCTGTLEPTLRRLFLLAALALASACAPLSAYRYTAFVPTARPIAWDGAAAERGEVHAEGTLTHADILPNLGPALHDSAMNLSASTAEGYLGVGLTHGFELGLRGTYSHYAWSEPSAAGTMPIPDRPALWGFGPEARLALALDEEKRMTMGIAANVMLYQLPWAEWDAKDCTEFTCDYRAASGGTDAKLVYSAGLYPSYAFGEGGKLGNAFLILAVHTDFKNDGFTNTQASGSTIQTAGVVPVVGGGASVHIGPLKLAATVFAPFADGAAGHQRPGGMITVGFDGKP
jgi:hypothetical protein